ncbi:MAG: hypothetical protein IPM23_23275 [Candidatus Melainabacteria bacterium]|nr:hypothetical protein [Candidatus Melainabacteria bacterium]
MTGRSNAGAEIIAAFTILAIAASGCSSTSSDGKPAATKQQSPGPGTERAAGKQRDKEVTVKTNTRPITVEGEVIDAWCYCSGVMGPGRGAEHEKCARLCVAGGVSAGILTDDGTVYIAAKHQAYKGCNGLLLPYVAKRVRATGWVAEKGGCRVLKISKVELAEKESSGKNSDKQPEPSGAEER